MKNIQVIDGATNCAYCVYQIDDSDFFELFPGEAQDIEFIEDFVHRVGEQRAAELLTPVWKKRIEKRDIVGLHGTLFFELNCRKEMYPNKRESDLDKEL